MAQAFSLLTPTERAAFHRLPTVAVTGAAGRIGSYFIRSTREGSSSERHAPQGEATTRNASTPDSAERRPLILIDHPDANFPDDLSSCGTVRRADLSDFGQTREALNGADVVLHLGAVPNPRAEWDELLPNNIVATRNVFEAARANGARRVVFASSIHAVSGYPTDYQVHPDDPVNPADVYGVSKAFGEAIARYYAEQCGVSAIVVRIAAFQPPERAEQREALRLMRAFVSDRDLAQLLRLAVDDQTLRFAILHGVSQNHFNRMDIGLAEELLGYAPQDDLTSKNPQLKDLNLPRESRA